MRDFNGDESNTQCLLQTQKLCIHWKKFTAKLLCTEFSHLNYFNVSVVNFLVSRILQLNAKNNSVLK